MNLFFDPLGTEQEKLQGPQIRPDHILLRQPWQPTEIPEDERARLHGLRDSNNSGAVMECIRRFGESERQRAEEQQKAAAAAELEAQRNQLLSLIEAALGPRLDEFITEEIAARDMKPETLKAHEAAFKLVKDYCASWSAPMPYCPANPIIVAAFLVKNSDQGLSYVLRLKRAISIVHERANLPDPCSDVLVAAVVRFFRKHKPSTPTTDASSQPNG